MVVACDSGPTLDGTSPGVGRDANGDLTLIAEPCSSTDLTALAIVEIGDDGGEDPVLRLEFDPPMNAWDVIVLLDPLDLDQPGFAVEVLDEDALAAALENTGESYQVLTELRFRTDGSTERYLTPFTPGLLSNNQAFDFDELIEDPASYECPRGGKPWREAFER
jgi:hypothetical protein